MDPLVLTRSQALTTRTPSEVDVLLRRGTWVSLRRGVYLTQPAVPDDRARAHAVLVQAAVLGSGVEAVGSHESAALLHGLPLLTPHVDRPLLTRLRAVGSARSTARAAAPLVSCIEPVDLTTVHGAPVTTVARTAVDLARTRSDVAAVLVLDAALRRVPRVALAQALERQHGWPGSVRARERLDFADGRAESPLESLGRLRFAQLGLPAPELQVVLGDDAGPAGRVDFHWPDLHTVGEADGRSKYVGDPAALFAEKEREDRLRDCGFEIFRFTWAEALRQPELLGDRAHRAFARAAARRPAA